MDIDELLQREHEELMDFYLLVSEEKHLIQNLLSRLRERLLPGEEDKFSLIKLAEEEDGFWQDFKRSVKTVNMLQSFKFIEVECSQLFKTSTADDDRLVELIDNIPSGVAVFCWFIDERGGGADGRLKTVNKVKKKGNYLELEVPRYSKLDDWIKEQFAEYDKQPGRDLIKSLEYLFDNKLEALKQEIEKIITLNYEKDRILLDDCREILSREGILADQVIFELIDSWAEDESEEAVKLYRQLIKEGSSPLYIISMIQRQLRLLLSVKELQKRMSGHREIARELEEHPYPIKKCLKQQRKYDREELIAYLRRLLEANRRIVRGKYVDQKDPVEDFLLGL